jgi:hypothetical protein
MSKLQMQKNPNVFVKQEKKNQQKQQQQQQQQQQSRSKKHTIPCESFSQEILVPNQKKNSCPPTTAVAAAVAAAIAAAASGYNNDSPNALPLLPASDRFPSLSPPISPSAFAQTTQTLPLSETLLSLSLRSVASRRQSSH